MRPTQDVLLPVRADVSEARLRLYAAAVVLFSERGFHSVTVRDIATVLGVQPAAMYAHVASKQQLLLELVLMGHSEQRDQLKQALLGCGPDPVEQVRELTRAHVRSHLRYPALARLSSRELRSLTDEQLVPVLAIRTETEQMFVDVVSRGIRLGLFESEQPHLAVRAIAAMGIRAAEWWPLDAFDAETVVETYAAYAVRILTT